MMKKGIKAIGITLVVILLALTMPAGFYALEEPQEDVAVTIVDTDTHEPVDPQEPLVVVDVELGTEEKELDLPTTVLASPDEAADPVEPPAESEAEPPAEPEQPASENTSKPEEPASNPESIAEGASSQEAKSETASSDTSQPVSAEPAAGGVGSGGAAQSNKKLFTQAPLQDPTAENEEYIPLEVEWVSETYDPYTEGDYTFTAQLPEGYTSEEPLFAIVQVRSPRAPLTALEQRGEDIMEAYSAPAGSWAARIKEEWRKYRAAFSWTPSSQTPWNGTMTNCFSGGAFYVRTAEDLAYAIHNAEFGQNIFILNDIDLNGSQRDWASVVKRAKPGNPLEFVTIAGQDESGNAKQVTIYNLGVINGNFVNEMIDCNVKNVSFRSARVINEASVNDGKKASIFGTSKGNRDFVRTYQNIYVYDSLFYAAGDHASALGAFENSRPDTDSFLINQCGTDGVYSFTGSEHGGGLVGFVSDYLTVTNSFSIDGVTMAGKAHSGGFISCANGNITVKDCFASTDVFAVKDTAPFIGYVGGNSIFERCYSTGFVEGGASLGGFVGIIGVNNNYLGVNRLNGVWFNDCYTTAMVGMQHGGQSLGGFAGVIYKSVPDNTPIGFYNCYAAGEVGCQDMNVAYGGFVGPSGGFIGQTEVTTNIDMIYCYYDKQTTAMRERAIGRWGTNNNPADDNSRQSPPSTTGNGLRGVTTTDKILPGSGIFHGMTGTSNRSLSESQLGFIGLKQDTGGARAANWFYSEDLYPQLTNFSQNAAATFGADFADKVKAYSQASVANVQLNTWDATAKDPNMPADTYDTVRDLTSPFRLSNPGNSSWSKRNAPPVTLYDGTHEIIELIESGGQYSVIDFAPGIEWVDVRTKVGGETGRRALRILPAVDLYAGEDQNVIANKLYHHADDARMALLSVDTTNQYITQGLYPDELSKFNTAQSTIYTGLDCSSANKALINNQAYQYIVDLDYMARAGTEDKSLATNSKAAVAIYPVTGFESGRVILGTKLDLTNSVIASKWNGKLAFVPDDIGRYIVEYTWTLRDMRYLKDSKMISILPDTYTATVLVEDEDKNPDDSALCITANEGITYTVPTATAARFEKKCIPYRTKAVTAWKEKDRWTTVSQLVLSFENLNIPGEKNPSGTYETVFTSKPLLNPKKGDTVTVDYINYTSHPGNNDDFYVTKTVLKKTYTIDQDSDGNWFIKYEMSDDLSANVKLVLTTKQSPERLVSAATPISSKYTGLDTLDERFTTQPLALLDFDDSSVARSGYIEKVATLHNPVTIAWYPINPNVYRLSLSMRVGDETEPVQPLYTKEGDTTVYTDANFTTPLQFPGDTGALQTVTVESNKLIVPSVTNDLHFNISFQLKTDFEFIKVDASQQNKPLPNAKFALYRCNHVHTTACQPTCQHKHNQFVEESGVTSCWELVGTDTSGPDGIIKFSGLSNGYYQMIELEAPSGYVLPTGQWRIYVDTSKAGLDQFDIVSVGKQDMHAFVKQDNGGQKEYALPNMQEVLLPQTGFGGHFWSIVTGISLVAIGISFAVVYTIKKKTAKKKSTKRI